MFFSKLFIKLALALLVSCCFSRLALAATETTFSPTKNFSVGPNGITKHIFLGNQVIATIDGTGQKATIYYIYPDHLGDSSVITKQDNSLDQVIDYYAFGAKRFDQQLGQHNEKRQFIGQEFDQLTSLQYLNNRYYDANLGRFISQDPLFWQSSEFDLTDPQSSNSYSYSRNNPIVYTDPFGLSTAIYNAMPKGGWRFGQKMGEFNGVVAYYNGIGSSKTAYSCVEYAKRYESQVYGIKNIGTVGDAKNMWSMLNKINNRLASTNSNYNFVKHNNGDGFNLPGEGDLLFWTEGQYGHVMVVTESKFNSQTNSGYVEIIDQNASNKAVRNFDVKKTSKGYLVMRNETTPMAGWFSPELVTKGVNKSANKSTVSSSKSFYETIWDNFKHFFNK